jgi:hypothetical protein
MPAALSVRDERLAKAFADRITGRIMELLNIEEQLKRLQEHLDQARETQPENSTPMPHRKEP